MKALALRMAASAFALLLLAGCSNDTATSPRIEQSSEAHYTTGFSAELLPQSFIDGGSASCSCRVLNASAGQTEVAIEVSGAVGLKAILCDLSYDAGRYTPVSAGLSGILGGTGETIELTITDDPGTFHLGQVLIHPGSQPGLTGSGIAATVVFDNAPGTGTRSASVAPWTDASQAVLTDSINGELVWYHTNQGDYDQNGLVSAADLVPIALYYGESVAPERFSETSVRFVVDGDGNGSINVSDITFVGMNFNNSILGGFRIYQSESAADYPETNTGPNGENAELLSTLHLDEIDPGKPVNYRRRYQYEPDLPQASLFYWIRPVDGDGNEGTPSTLLTGFGVRAPRDDASQSAARLDGSNNTLVWFYSNTGDTNQDGVVSIADVSELTGYIDTLGPFDPNKKNGLRDVNHDNVINQMDVDLIYASQENTVSGYNIYRSSDPADYPSANNAESGSAPYASLSFSAGISQPHNQTPNERLYFVYETTEPNMYHWIRPYDALGNEGTPSILQQPLDPDAHVPLGGSSATTLSWNAASSSCTWGYYNAGDYNQDSMVNPADQTAIGTHFGNVGPFEPDSIDAVIDGNRDEEISALDVDLIAKYHENQVAGYNIYLSNVAADYSFGSTNPSVIDAIGSVVFGNATGMPNMERLQYEYSIPAGTQGYYLWVRPYNNNGLEGIASNLVVIDG